MGVERGRATEAVPTSAASGESAWRPPKVIRKPFTGRASSAGEEQSAVEKRAATAKPLRRDKAERGPARLRRPARRRPGVIEAVPGVEMPPDVRMSGARDRVLGFAGVSVTLIALAWVLLADGGATPVGVLVLVGLILAGVDAVAWRRTGHLDLAVNEDERIPAVPWGLMVGPAALFGLVAALVAGASVVAVIAAATLVAVLPGLFARLPATGVSNRVAGHARRVRMFARSNGAAAGESVTGYATPVGTVGVRLFVFAPNGTWGDVMLRPDEVDDVARLARVELADEHDPTVARRLAIGPPLWTLMNRSW